MGGVLGRGEEDSEGLGLYNSTEKDRDGPRDPIRTESFDQSSCYFWTLSWYPSLVSRLPPLLGEREGVNVSREKEV